jgi:ABC-type oligopeptide transport system ATPase subunit
MNVDQPSTPNDPTTPASPGDAAARAPGSDADPTGGAADGSVAGGGNSDAIAAGQSVGATRLDQIAGVNPGANEPEHVSDALLDVRHLKTYFPIKAGLLQRTTGYVKAVDDVSFYVRPGETLGLVGESGCGKTTVGRTLLRLIPHTGGSVMFDGTDVFKARGTTLRRLRQQMQIIFQDPAGSLNPRMRIASIVSEPMKVHGIATEKDELRQRAEELLERCGMPRLAADRYPHEFSGGQRQRIGIARALALNPSFIVCDEPTSALDVSIQSQILNLLADLRDEFKLSYLFISHDMAVIQHICDRVAVMFRGKIVEHGTREEVIENPQHQYTRALLSAVPVADPVREKKRIVFEGMAS